MEIEIKDLLKEIVNEEELPIKIKVFNHIFVYTGDKRLQRLYKMESQENYLFRDFVYFLNTKVKILDNFETNKKIEKLDISRFPRRNNSLKKTAIKVNEIIDKINENKG